MGKIFKLIGLALVSILAFCDFSFAGVDGEEVYFYHTDPVGTPLAMTDVNGNVVWRADYKPFGEEESVTGSLENNERFVGKEKDVESGLSYFGARYMETRIGRFISPDPVGAVDPHSSRTNEALLLDPQRLNPYAYGLNNPYRYVDPDGRNPLAIVALALAYNLFFPSTTGETGIQAQTATQFAADVFIFESGRYFLGKSWEFYKNKKIEENKQSQFNNPWPKGEPLPPSQFQPDDLFHVFENDEIVGTIKYKDMPYGSLFSKYPEPLGNVKGEFHVGEIRGGALGDIMNLENF